MNVVERCIYPEQFKAVVRDDHRQAVIDCLRASWRQWDYSTRRMMKHAVGTWVDVSDTTHMHQALAKMSNDMLAEILYSVYDNGDLHVIESDGLVFSTPSVTNKTRH